ncbi:MAG: hypothetical protein WCE30_03810 [Mycobacterium sp.]
MALKPGVRLATAASACEVLVIRAPTTDELLTCAGGEMTRGVVAAADSDTASKIELGKRYVDEASGLEVLCVKPGSGPLEIGDRVLVLREAKPLPASD